MLSAHPCGRAIRSRYERALLPSVVAEVDRSAGHHDGSAMRAMAPLVLYPDFGSYGTRSHSDTDIARDFGRELCSILENE
jgi:hypothetical protein